MQSWPALSVSLALSAILIIVILEKELRLASVRTKPNSKELKSREVFGLSAKHSLSGTIQLMIRGQGA